MIKPTRRGINAIQRHIGYNKVDIILGPDYSGVTFPSMYLTREAYIPQFTSSIAPKITKEVHPTIFRTRSTDYYNAKAVVDYAVKERKYTKIATAFTNIEYGKSGINTATEIMKEQGLTPVANVSHEFGDRDLKPNAVRIGSSNAEAVIVWAVQGETYLLYKELRKMGWKGEFLYGSLDSIFAAYFQKGEIDGVGGVANFIYTDPRAKTDKFVENYRKMWNGQIPSSHSAAYYDGVYFIKYALEKSSIDKKKFVEFARSVRKWEGIQGIWRPADFGNGDIGSFATLAKYVGEKPVVLRQYE